MAIRYETTTIPSGQQVAEVFKRSGINRPVEDVARIQQMVDQADLVITAWDGDELVGIARSITDFAYCCYLSDLAVDKAYQRRGIGQELVRLTQGLIGDAVTLILISAPTAVEYYPRLGFQKVDKAFSIPRKR